jgi:hypothetical protein
LIERPIHQPRRELGASMPREADTDAPAVRKSSRAARPRLVNPDFVTEFELDDEDNAEKVYSMESILEESGSGKDLMYKIKWEGFDAADFSWETAAYVRSVMPATVAQWHEGKKEERARARAGARAERVEQQTAAVEARRKLAKEQYASARSKADMFTLCPKKRVAVQDLLCLTLKTSRGFSPRANQRPLDKPSTLNMWDKLKFVRLLLFGHPLTVHVV